MDKINQYRFEANRFSAVEVLAELYNQYYAYIGVSTLDDMTKKKYFDYILDRQQELTIEKIKTPYDIQKQKEKFKRFKEALAYDGVG